MNKKFVLAVFTVFYTLINNSYDAQAQISQYGTIVSDGIVRDYKIYVPAIYDGSVAVPLIFNFHGYGSNYNEQELYGDYRAIADTANFIVVHPNGTLDNQNTNSWNTFDNSSVNDIQFVSNLIDSLRLTYNIDTTAIYSTGMSNGGFMSYDLACQLSNRIAAVASVTGSIITTHLAACNPQHPMPVMQIHGTADGTVPYGGIFIFSPIENVVNYWVQFNNCNTTPVFNALPDVVTTDNCTAEHYVYQDGDNGVEVEFYKIIGGGHSWPGAPININTTNMDFSASQEIWRFFRKFRLGGSVVTSNQNAISKQNNFDVFPNPSNGAFTIKFDNTKQRKIELCNALGQLVSTFYSNSNQVVLTPEQQGMYFITVFENDGSVQSKRLVKL
jgi:polyhydroxybutyrate depolymerase